MSVCCSLADALLRGMLFLGENKNIRSGPADNREGTLPKKSSNSLKINRHTKLFSDTPKHIVKEFAK